MRIQNGYSLIAHYAFATIAIVAVARAASAAALGGLDRALHAGSGFVRRYPNVEALANRYHWALRGAVSTIISLVALVVLFEEWGIDAFAWFEQGRIGASIASEFSPSRSRSPSRSSFGRLATAQCSASSPAKPARAIMRARRGSGLFCPCCAPPSS